MKYKLNLNGPASRILPVIGWTAVILPLGFSLCAWFLERLNHPVPQLKTLATLSFFLGSLIAVCLLVLGIIEAVQDTILDSRYRKTRRQRIPLSGAYSECPYCGCQKVHDFDDICPACGQPLQKNKVVH